ncbi:MAG: lamin tail domain-containing protein [Anaerolineales bacterium]|nr:lamin tail domain-containing protein [Anaerolineales bacterium]
MERRRLIGYLLLNVLVSAIVVGMILFFYDRTYRSDCAQLPQVPPFRLAPDATPVTGEVRVDIVSIIGAGAAESEIAVVRNNGAESIVLTGWRLQTGGGGVYTFPQLTLYSGGSVQVHTISGEDTPVDLYWGRPSPAWGSGEIASLYDSQGILRALYRIP